MTTPRTFRRSWRPWFDVAAIYLISCLSVTDALTCFLAGVVLLAITWTIVYRRRPGAAGVVHRLLCSVAFGVVLFEAGLHLAAGRWHGAAANYVYGGYHSDAGGIYEVDAQLGERMRPNCERRMYWSGHFWRHDANAAGYRGEQREQADAVFLGDSMIYGHGVETDQTVSAHFEALTGRPAVNLGQQGFNAVQASIVFRRHGTALRPRWVFYCAHFNDLHELQLVYTKAELERFLAAPPGEAENPAADLKKRTGLAKAAREAKVWWTRHAALPLYSARALKALRRMLGDDGAGKDFRTTTDASYVPTPDVIDRPFVPIGDNASPELAFQWRVHRHALSRIKADCDRIGAELIVFDVGYPRQFAAATEALADSLDVRYVNAGAMVLDAALNDEPMYLPNDGHWTAKGCERVAEALAKGLGLFEQ